MEVGEVHNTPLPPLVLPTSTGERLKDMTRIQTIKENAGPDLPISEGDTINATMQVVSIKEKYGKRGSFLSVVAKVGREDEISFWFSRSIQAQSESPVREGDKVNLSATVSGLSGDQRMVFLKSPKIKGMTCSHSHLVVEGDDYVCDSCGCPFKVTPTG
jgi:hypothetical protein